MPNEDPKSTLIGHQPPREVQPQSPHDGSRSSGGLDLNSASEEQIAEIDMIGKKLAHALVQQRSQQGGFRSWEELQKVPGLDPMKIAELQRASRLGGIPS
ncbi:MAG: ComE protein [Myxococcaceae bacterium]|nr:ComE protein [Myxococcaceae bacterium]